MKSAPFYFFPGIAVLAAAMVFAPAVERSADAQVVHARVLKPIATAQRTTLARTVQPRVRDAEDLGSAPGSTVLPEMTIRFNMTAAQHEELQSLLADLQNPASPRYHQWLTPESFGERFGMAQSDLDKVQTWLTEQGFKINSVARANNFISFSGTVAQAQTAFATQIHTLRLHGEAHLANVTDLSLPSAFAASVLSVQGVNDLRPQPHFTSASGNHFVVPADLQAIYDVTPVYATGVDGTGVTIVVAGQAAIDKTLVATFRSRTGLPVRDVTIKQSATPSTASGDQTESYADLQYAGALAPGADLVFSTSNNVFVSIQNAVDQNMGQVVSMSYGTCEKNLTPSNLDYLNAIGEEANALGITIVAASGDAGAADCEVHGSSGPTSATTGLYVDLPAGAPSYTGVGGTLLSEGSGSYWSATNAPSFGSALGYIPEVAWNENGSTYHLFSSGGGVSRYFSKPIWQVGVGVPADGKRDVPDIALTSGAHDAYLVCVPTYCTNGLANASGVTYGLAGTSLAAPTVAGALALVIQKEGARQGNVNPRLYSLAGSSYATNIFHDVTSGDNRVPCTAGSTDCASGGSIGYTAGVGYDLVTGWGSLDVANLVSKWELSVPIGQGTLASTTAVAASASSGVQNSSLDFTATVTGTGVTPTGTVYYVVNGSTVAFGTLSGGAYRYTMTLSSTNNFQIGDNTVQVRYSGDAVYASSVSTEMHVTVTTTSTSSASDFTLTPATSSVTVASGGTATVTFNVASVNGFVGTIGFSLGSATSGFYSCPGFSPSTVPLSIATTSGSTVLSVKTSTCSAIAAVHPASAPLRKRGLPWSAGGVVVAGLMLIVLPKRRAFVPLLCVVFLVGMLGMSGCGSGANVKNLLDNSGGGGGGSVQNTPAGTYQLIVTASGVNAGGTTVSKYAVVNVTVN